MHAWIKTWPFYGSNQNSSNTRMYEVGIARNLNTESSSMEVKQGEGGVGYQCKICKKPTRKSSNFHSNKWKSTIKNASLGYWLDFDCDFLYLQSIAEGFGVHWSLHAPSLFLLSSLSFVPWLWGLFKQVLKGKRVSHLAKSGVNSKEIKCCG